MQKKTMKKLARANDAAIKSSNDQQKRLIMHTGGKIRIKLMKGNQDG